MKTRIAVVLSTAFFVILPVSAQMADCPMHEQHTTATSKADGSSEHGAGVDHRHDTLGVAHETTHHSFRLFDDGAAIELRANVASDDTTVHAIRTHIQTIAEQFKANNFSTPMFVHDKTPDGLDAMKQLHDRIEIRYESLSDGARIRMVTRDADALAALHKFMKFQIVEHRTGDTGKVEKEVE